MTLEELIVLVQRKADTEGTAINAAEVSRVVSLTLAEIKERLAPEVQSVVDLRLTDVGRILALVFQGWWNRRDAAQRKFDDGRG